jgi:glycosyltransferase involved in cell wall biosynthesis
MRILLCASEAPLPPMNGMRLQLRELVSQLAHRHEVCILAFRWPEQHGSAPAGVELIEVKPPPGGTLHRLGGWMRAVPGRRPLEPVKLTGRMSNALRELLAERDFDVAHVTLGSLADVAPALHGLPAVIAPLDAWHINERGRAEAERGIRRAVLRAQQRRVRRFTASAYRPYRRAVFVSEQDAHAAAELDSGLATTVIPNGVDLEYFHPGSAPATPGRLVFTGAMATPANQLASTVLAREILPHVQARRPEARLAIVGRDPSPAVRELAALDGVEVSGTVPDVRPWLWDAEVFACPMRSGTGIKNKLLEALACGLPCVTSSLGSQGLHVTDGRELLIASPSGEAFASAIVELLEHRELRAALSATGRRYVAEHHGWPAVGRAYEALYREVSMSSSVRR